MQLVWYRNDLRTQNHHGLKAACDAGGAVMAVYCFDPFFYSSDSFEKDLGLQIKFGKTGKYRAEFIRQSIADLRNQLNAMGIPLMVSHSSPAGYLPTLVKEHNVTDIYLQKEWTRDELTQENELGKALGRLNNPPKGHRFYDQFLFHPDDIPFDHFQKIPKVFTEFRKRCEKQADVRPLVSVDGYQQEMPHIDQGDLPSLQELGLSEIDRDDRSAFPFEGGSKAAWERLQHYFWDTKKLQEYKQTRNGLIGTDYSSKFSAWLAQGCISAPEIYYQVKKFEEQIKKNQDTYWLIFELIWRDFFKYVSLKHKEEMFALGGLLDKEYDWKNNLRELDRWINGETHERFVNANMKEIAATGFMSNRGRQNVASYWSKHLQQDWRLGAAYFEHILIDYDVHSNYGNWMYNSGVGNDPRDRKFNIVSQADRYDQNGEYQRLWLEDELF
ncbi:DASH family cryptochrome [Nonlabens xiamenensis]|uniref:DASH family cryptochrome n=1 Tax=Nonlabens xiamenensis TaxID=2341043 RepID=UPI000F609753|nr:DASH family cryptochrome [Nonlabens xiamenensis]